MNFYLFVRCTIKRDFIPILKKLSIAATTQWRYVRIISLVSGTFIFLPTINVAQEIKSNSSQPSTSEKVPFSSMVSFRTNVVDWALLAPNLTLELDLSNSIYNRYTLSFGVKGNWNTHQTYKPSILYNFFDARTEIRYYWRTEQKQGKIEETSSFTEWVTEELFSRTRKKPKYWRAYYIGGYAHTSKYTFKFGEKGIQGRAYGFGASTGLGIPLYGYKERFVDLELGASLGWIITKYDRFTYDRASDCYPILANESKRMHFIPYPFITDIRVAFVFRFSSIKDKYKAINYEKLTSRQERSSGSADQKERKISKPVYYEKE